jgi:hypothetical protein
MPLNQNHVRLVLRNVTHEVRMHLLVAEIVEGKEAMSAIASMADLMEAMSAFVSRRDQVRVVDIFRNASDRIENRHLQKVPIIESR